MSVIRTILCDDEKLLCENYRMCMEKIPKFECVGMAYNVEECIRLLNAAEADLLLLDVQISSASDGIDIVPQIKQMKPEIKIIMLTSHKEDEKIFRAIAAGVEGYVIKRIECFEMFE